MKKIFILLLVITSAFVIAHLKVNIPTVKAATPIHQGDLIISGNDVFTIKGETFTINGSITATENATLELKDAVINFTQRSDYDHGIFLDSGNTKLKVDNVTIISTYDMSMNLQTNCSANVDDLHSPVRIWLETYRASLIISNSEVHWYFGGPSNLTISNCEIMDFESYGGDISISDSNIGSCFLASSSIKTSNVTIGNLNATGIASILVSENLTVNGNLNFKWNATLRLENARLELLQTYNEEISVTFDDYSNLESTNSEVTSDFAFIMYFYGDTTASVNGLTMPTSQARVYAFDESNLYLDNFTSRYLRAFNYSDVTLANSAPFYLRSYDRARFYIFNSTVRKAYVFDLSHIDSSRSVFTEDVRIYNNTYLEAIDSALNTLHSDDTSAAKLINCTYTQCTAEPISHITVYWYLDAKVVDMVDQPINLANVSAYTVNLKDSDLTNSEGWARLVLLDKTIDHLGEHSMQMNYTVYATYETYVNYEVDINMTDNKIVILELGFIIPEYPSIAILPGIMIATLLAAIAHRKRYST